MYGAVSGVSAGPTVVASVVVGGTIADQVGVPGVPPVITLPSTGIAPAVATTGGHHEWLMIVVLVLAVWTLFAAIRVVPRLLPKDEE
ncbi:MAG TPA: hypothetical protein VH482_30620 [Thermomicrobiales bacterium]|jgi:hypothetical protein